METQATFLPREMDLFYLLTLPKGFLIFVFLRRLRSGVEFSGRFELNPLCKAVHE